MDAVWASPDSPPKDKDMCTRYNIFAFSATCEHINEMAFVTSRPDIARIFKFCGRIEKCCIMDTPIEKNTIYPHSLISVTKPLIIPASMIFIFC